MSTKYPGGVIKSSPVVPAGPYQNSSASGVWTMEQAGYWIKQGNWPTAGNVQGYNLYSWGSNITYGQLGLGNTTNYSSPKQVGTLNTWLKISAGRWRSSFSIKNNGTLWSWGSNITYGQLGLGNTTYYSSPKQVGALTTWLNIAGGHYHTVATKTDGTLWSWGYNTKGQLGLGNTTYYSSPKQVGLLTTWSNISCGKYYTMATKTDGTLWAWGQNDSGQLGLGTSGAFDKRSSPVQVGALTTWLNITAGYNNTLATKTDGTLWSWGHNHFGKLGLNNLTDYSSPKQIGALTTWSKSSCGNYNSIATKTDGTLWSWGYNSEGQLGLGNIINYSSPVQVGLLTNWSNITTGSNSTFSMATKTDGTLWSWGQDNVGQLGQGTTANYSSPKQVGSLTTWLNVAAGYQHVLAILS